MFRSLIFQSKDQKGWPKGTQSKNKNYNGNKLKEKEKKEKTILICFLADKFLFSYTSLINENDWQNYVFNKVRTSFFNDFRPKPR